MIQPWASLFMKNESIFETRTWKTNYRGQLAIHTSKKIDVKACQHETIQALLNKHDLSVENLPTGCIIGVCTLTNCIKVIENHSTTATLEDGRLISGKEYFLGDYREGNYAWEVKDKKIIHPSIPAKGRLGLWEMNIEV